MDQQACRFHQTVKSELARFHLENDDVLLDYIVCMLTNKRSRQVIQEELGAFLGSAEAASFVEGLFSLIERQASSPADSMEDCLPQAPISRRASRTSINKATDAGTLRPFTDFALSKSGKKAFITTYTRETGKHQKGKPQETTFTVTIGSQQPSSEHQHGQAQSPPKPAKEEPGDCTFFPLCHFPNTCQKRHPKISCKFDGSCFNPICNYVHSKVTPSHISIQCSFFPACMNPNCPYLHETTALPCKNGVHCQISGCSFVHPNRSVNKTMIKAKCRFGSACLKGAACPFIHDTAVSGDASPVAMDSSTHPST